MPFTGVEKSLARLACLMPSGGSYVYRVTGDSGHPPKFGASVGMNGIEIAAASGADPLEVSGELQRTIDAYEAKLRR